MGAKHWFDTNEGIDSEKYMPTGQTREDPGSLLPGAGLGWTVKGMGGDDECGPGG